MEYIPYARQWIEEDDIQAVVDVLRSDYLTTGPKVDEFEEKFAAYVDVKYAVAVSSGTAALHAACFAAGLGPGDEVITTPITFAASANCVRYVGATPVFADINLATYNIDPVEIEKKITSKTKAIIAVHFAGLSCEMEQINAIARKHNLIVIEDAAHALGAVYKGKKVGTLGKMATFSFHPVKQITTGEGGMVTTEDFEMYQILKMFRSHGITRDRARFKNADHGPWYYEQHFLGYNYRMTDLQAALGLSQLTKIEKFLQRRLAIADKYTDALANYAGVQLPGGLSEAKSAWHLYCVRLDTTITGTKEKVSSDLLEKGIGTNVHYLPVYRHPDYINEGFAGIRCHRAELFYQGALTLPLYPLLTDLQVERVVQALQDSIVSLDGSVNKGVKLNAEN